MFNGGSARTHVRLFGGAGVRAEQGPVHLSPRQLALVALVYGHGSKGLSRPRAAKLIWGTVETPVGRHRIRQLLVEIRSRVGRRLIGAHQDELRPQADVLCDLVTFEQHLASGSLLDAALLAKSGFAALTKGEVAEDYDDWRGAEELALLRRVRAQSLGRWSTAEAAGDWVTAGDAAEALYALEPQDPEAVRRMIDVLGRQGQPQSAEEVFAEYCAALHPPREPEPDLLRSIRLVRRLEKSRAVLVSTEREAPLVGRREVLASARTVFDHVDAGRFGFVLISGESGIGKTRVLRELHREAVLRDFRALEAQAVELESRIPLNPLLDALKSVDLKPHLRSLGSPWDAVVAAMLPLDTLDEPAVAPPPIQESALPRRLLDAFSLLLEGLAADQPTLLFLDDLHWADATTVAALQFMQRRWARGSFGIIATIRPELVDPGDPLAKYLSAPGEAPGIHRIELGELSMEAALQLVEHIGKGDIGQAVAQRICALAGLHPLYLTELARDYMAGRLRLPELPVDEVTIPVSLKQILDSRLVNLSEHAGKMAGLLAVAARPMRLSDVAALARLPPDDAADAVDELRRARLVEYERDRVRIAHELFRSAIYMHLSEPRRAINHRAVASHLLGEAPEESLGELATHYARAGDAELAAKYGWTAAKRAMESGAVAEAAHFFQLVTDNDQDPVHRAEATAALARALHLTRDINRANPLLELAASRLYAVGKPVEALRLEIKRVEGMAEVGSATLTDLLERLNGIKAEARGREDWEGVALALDAELRLRAQDGDVPGVRELMNDLRSVIAVGGPAACALAHAGLAVGLFFGDPAGAFSSSVAAVGLTESGPVRYRFTALNRLIIVLYHRGALGLESSKPFIDEALDLATRSGDRLQRYSLESNIAAQFMDAGDLERAGVMLERAGKIFGSADMTAPRVNHACNLGELSLA
ncbi:MAG TPA: AAA family ATPase, partial [Longimicrobiales bacterium]|nr:AAA family ATPase [Longimicrobiales bacterium]